MGLKSLAEGLEIDEGENLILLRSPERGVTPREDTNPMNPCSKIVTEMTLILLLLGLLLDFLHCELEFGNYLGLSDHNDFFGSKKLAKCVHGI